MGIALDLPEYVMEEATVKNLYSYYDVLITKQFDGHYMNWTFTEEEEAIMHSLQGIVEGESLQGER